MFNKRRKLYFKFTIKFISFGALVTIIWISRESIAPYRNPYKFSISITRCILQSAKC